LAALSVAKKTHFHKNRRSLATVGLLLKVRKDGFHLSPPPQIGSKLMAISGHQSLFIWLLKNDQMQGVRNPEE
jgi:hypothetical protein